MESIGNWALKLSADASGLVQGLQNASNATAVFATKAAAMSKMAASAVNSGLASILHIDLGQQAAEVGKVMSAIVGVGQGFTQGGMVGGAIAIGTATVALAGFAWQTMDAVAAQVRLGKELGVTAREAAGLQAVAARRGIGDQLGPSLAMYTEKLAHLRREIDSGHGGAQTNALARMGINAREFVSLDLPGQFARLAEGSQATVNPMERNAALIELLGHRGMALAPLFKESASDLRNMGDAAGGHDRIATRATQPAQSGRDAGNDRAAANPATDAGWRDIPLGRVEKFARAVC